MDLSTDLLEREFRSITARLAECESAISEWSAAEKRSTQHVLRRFLIANGALLRLAADAYAALTKEDRMRLCSMHNLTEGLLPVSDAADFIYGALEKAESPAWGQQPEPLVWYTSTQIEMIPRVLSYAKYVAKPGGLSAQMCPIADSLPRHLRKLAKIQRQGSTATVSITVHGGRVEENRSAFDSLRLPPGIQRAATAAVGAPGAWDPFHIVLSCQSSDLPKLVQELDEHEFSVEE